MRLHGDEIAKNRLAPKSFKNALARRWRQVRFPIACCLRAHAASHFPPIFYDHIYYGKIVLFRIFNLNIDA